MEIKSYFVDCRFLRFCSSLSSLLPPCLPPSPQRGAYRLLKTSNHRSEIKQNNFHFHFSVDFHFHFFFVTLSPQGRAYRHRLNPLPTSIQPQNIFCISTSLLLFHFHFTTFSFPFLLLHFHFPTFIPLTFEQPVLPLSFPLPLRGGRIGPGYGEP